MADISRELQAFKSAVYGEDVRDAMISAMNKINTVNEDCVAVIESQVQITEELDEKIAESDNALSYQTESVKLGFTSGYIKTGGLSIGNVVDTETIVSSNTYVHSIVGCSEGDTFILNLKGGGNPRAWAFIDSDNKLLSVSVASLMASDLFIKAPENSAYAIFNSEKNELGVCMKGYLPDRINKLASDIDALNTHHVFSGDISKLIKELYIPNLESKGYTLTKVNFYIGRQNTKYGYYFSEIRLFFNDDNNRYISVALCRAEDKKSEDYAITDQHYSVYSTPEQAIFMLNQFNNTVYHFSEVVYGTSDVIEGYIIFDVSSLAQGLHTFSEVNSDNIQNITFSPSIHAYINDAKKGERLLVHPLDNQIGASYSYQAPDQFMKDDLVKVYDQNGSLILPDSYTKYKQGKIVFNSAVSYDTDDLLIEYTRHTDLIPDFSNDLSENRNGFRLHEDNADNSYLFVQDPVEQNRNVLKLCTDAIVSKTGKPMRIQFDRMDLNYTELRETIKIYVPSGVLNALISYQDSVHWFGFAGAWVPYGVNTSDTENMYSGFGNGFDLYKTNAEDTDIYYHIRNRKRTIQNGAEVYTVLSEATSDFKVLADEWITIERILKVGNTGYCKLTITDSAGTHVLETSVGGVQGAGYVGVPDPENESELYGSAVAEDIPYRVITQSNMMKIYTSIDIANHVVTENGECALYFKDYACTDGKNVNAI